MKVYACFYLKLIARIQRGGTSGVVQWLRVCILMQGTWVWTLVPEDSTCPRATKLVCHNCWARVLQLLKPVCSEPLLPNKRGHCSEKPMHCNWRVAPCLPQLEKARMQHQCPSTAREKNTTGNDLTVTIIYVSRDVMQVSFELGWCHFTLLILILFFKQTKR